MSLLDQLITDLQYLSNETKKNNPMKQVDRLYIAQLSQQALESLRQYKGTLPTMTQLAKETFPSQAMLKLLLQAAQNKPEPKQMGQAVAVISIVQKLHNLNVIDDPLQLLQCIYLMRDIGDDQVQLRLTQCTLQMITTSFIELQYPEHYEKCLAILFMLAGSRNPIVQTTSVTGAQQVVMVLFNSYDQTNETQVKNTHTLFMDLVKGMQGQKVIWISGGMSRGLSRDLLIDIIKQLGVRFRQLDETLSKYVTEYISPVIYEELALDDSDIKFNARRVRAAFRLMLYLRRDIPLVKHVFSLFQRVPAMHYLRFWILEGVRELVSDLQLVMMLHKNPEDGQQSYLHHLVQLIKSSVEQQELTTTTKPSPHKQVRFLDSNTLDYSDSPTYTTAQFEKEAVECVLSLSEQLLAIAKDSGVSLGSRNYQTLKPQPHRHSPSVDESGDTKQSQLSQSQMSDRQRYVFSPNCKDLYNIVESIWVMFIKVLRRLSMSQTDERLIQSTLNTTQIWINVTGSIGQLRVRDQFLKFLTSLCTNDNPSEPLTEKNLQSSKTLFNVAHCLGGIMDVNSWYVVLQTMHIFEGQLARTQAQTASGDNEASMWTQELQILSSVLDGLFTQSHLYDDAQLLQVLDALNQVTLGVLEQLSTAQSSDTRALQFCLAKITQMAGVNWHRVNVFWEFVAAHFSCVANCKSQEFRQVAVEALISLIEQGFAYFLKVHSNKPDQEEMSPGLKSQQQWNKKYWQQSLLQPVHEVVKFGGTRQLALGGILKLLQNNGHEFTQGGFMSIIQILSLSCQLTQEDTSYVSIGFAVLQLIICQYLSALEPQTTKVLLPLIADFRTKTTEPNISYTSINLIWQLADNLSKLQQWSISLEELEGLWESVLYSLKGLCLDAAPDVRQSALHIIIQITLINCANFRIEFQVQLLRVCLLNIFDALIGRVAQLQKQQGIFHAQTPKFLSNDQTPKFTRFSEAELSLNQQHEQQWEETLKLIVGNLSKVVKKLQSVSGYEEYSQGIHNEVFVRLFIMLRFQSLDLKHEIARFIKENTQLIVEKLHDTSFEWSKEFLSSVNEFLFQKVTDQRDLKTLNSKILPEFCETFTLLLKAYSLGMKFEEGFVNSVLETYQQIVDQPCRISTVNVKLWFDERYLHDYLCDFITYSGPELPKFLQFINFNLKKPVGQNLVTDNLLKKYLQLFADIVCEPTYILRNSSEGAEHQLHLDLLKEYVSNAESIIECRRDARQLNQVKSYNNSQLPLWNICSPILQRVLIEYANKLDATAVLSTVLKPMVLNEVLPNDALKSCSDLDISWCQFAITRTPALVQGYWQTLQGASAYTDKLLYETRKQVIGILTSQTDSGIIPILRMVVEDLLQSFNRDEQVHGWRVQELTFLLFELQKVDGNFLVLFTRSLTQLIATKEQEIKLPLQELFLVIATVIEKQFN